MPSNTPDGRKRNVPFILLSISVWFIAGPIGFLAALLWQGAVIGWTYAMDLMERA